LRPCRFHLAPDLQLIETSHVHLPITSLIPGMLSFREFPLCWKLTDAEAPTDILLQRLSGNRYRATRFGIASRPLLEYPRWAAQKRHCGEHAHWTFIEEAIPSIFREEWVVTYPLQGRSQTIYISPGTCPTSKSSRESSSLSRTVTASEPCGRLTTRTQCVGSPLVPLDHTAKSSKGQTASPANPPIAFKAMTVAGRSFKTFRGNLFCSRSYRKDPGDHLSSPIMRRWEHGRGSGHGNQAPRR
jgi:hypothetical protein